MAKKKIKVSSDQCDLRSVKNVKDALEALSGGWKLPILLSLTHGNKRFKQIATEVTGISDKMLSKELKDLEINQLVKRTVHDTFPPTVQYAATDHAYTLNEVLCALRDWGILHRKKIMGH